MTLVLPKKNNPVIPSAGEISIYNNGELIIQYDSITNKIIDNQFHVGEKNIELNTSDLLEVGSDSNYFFIINNINTTEVVLDSNSEIGTELKFITINSDVRFLTDSKASFINWEESDVSSGRYFLLNDNSNLVTAYKVLSNLWALYGNVEFI